MQAVLTHLLLIAAASLLLLDFFFAGVPLDASLPRVLPISPRESWAKTEAASLIVAIDLHDGVSASFQRTSPVDARYWPESA